MNYLPIVISCALGYKFCDILTHPKSKIWNNLPKLEGKRVQFFPSIKIKVKGRVVHLHHWFNYSILLGASILVTRGILDSWITRGLLMGGVIQGLSIPSARKLIYKEEWIRKMLE